MNRWSCGFSGICEEVPRGQYATQAECEAVCQGAENKELLYLITSYNPEDVLNLGLTDQYRVIYDLTGVHMETANIRPTFIPKLLFEKFRPKLISKPISFPKKRMQLNSPPYKVIKTSLASIVRNSRTQDKIQDTACVFSKITSRALLFLKLYLIHHQNDRPAITVTEGLVKEILKAVSTKVSNAGAKASSSVTVKAKIRAFYQEHFVPMLPENDTPLPQTNLG